MIGSPYCVRDYVVDERFRRRFRPGRSASATGRPGGWRADCSTLRAHDVAPDHPWLTERPDCFLPGKRGRARPAPGGVHADRARDRRPRPGIPTSTLADVVQFHAYSPSLRDAVCEMLIGIAQQCDGLRCDMATLMTNEVSDAPGASARPARPGGGLRPTVIGRVKAVDPDFLFMAEAYWDMEWTLQQQGFDLCYDKRLYRPAVHDDADAVRGHLSADDAYQERLIRFIENHDEPRAAATFEPAKARAAAVVMSHPPRGRPAVRRTASSRGAGRTSPSSARGPDEPEDEDLPVRLYETPDRAVADADLRDGDWRLCDCTGWPDNRLVSPVGRVVLGVSALASRGRGQPVRLSSRGACPDSVARGPAQGRVDARRLAQRSVV